MSELTLEELASKLDSIHKTANAVKADVEEMKERDHPLHQAKKANETEEDYKARVAQEEEDEKKEAQEKEDEEKKEARHARYNAMKIALAEEDEENRDAAMNKAMNDVEHRQKDPSENTTRNDKEKTAQDEEEKKEENAAVASIIGDKREEFINKILSANKVFNASNIKSVEKRVRKASLTKLKAEYNVIKPFIANTQPTQTATEQPEQIIPYFANIMNPEQVDASQLNASSPDSAFAQISTKELLEMAN